MSRDIELLEGFKVVDARDYLSAVEELRSDGGPLGGRKSKASSPSSSSTASPRTGPASARGPSRPSSGASSTPSTGGQGELFDVAGAGA